MIGDDREWLRSSVYTKSFRKSSVYTKSFRKSSVYTKSFGKKLCVTRANALKFRPAMSEIMAATPRDIGEMLPQGTDARPSETRAGPEERNKG